jgi:hypothetical protein
MGVLLIAGIVFIIVGLFFLLSKTQPKKLAFGWDGSPPKVGFIMAWT